MIVSELPKTKDVIDAYPGYQVGGGWFPVPKANAWVAVIDTPRGKRIEIWPEDGGYLVADVAAFSGDLAPFHG